MTLDLAAIKARLAAATPAPWHCADEDGYWFIYGSNNFQVHNTSNSADLKTAEANRLLIENAPTDLALLIAEVERLRAAIVAWHDADNTPGFPTAEEALVAIARELKGRP